MQALRYHGPGAPLRLEEIPRPEPGPGEVLVRVEAAGLCHTELHFLSGLLDLGVHPLTLGHEVVGTVEEVGPPVEKRAPGANGAPDAGWPASRASGPAAEERRVGDRVIVYYYVGCGRCRWCAGGDENLCPELRAEYGFISDGGFAEYIVAPARNAVPLPGSVDFRSAAPIGCSVTTGVHACELARLERGEVAVVYGVGAVGFGLVQLARLRGAEVIGIGRTPAKLEMARELGADHVVDARAADPAEAVLDITGGRGADAIFELVATRETMAASTAMLGRRGRLVFVGYSEDDFRVHPIQLVIREASVIGSVGNTRAELRRSVELVAEGKVRTVVDRALPLERHEEAVEALREGELVGRAVFEP